jgi:NAD(P)-dependent dehydrogenase (short-subunit alcohol dehydrogenase family)
VVAVSSAAHLRGSVDFDDIHFVTREYQPWTAYGQSKTANVLFAVEAARLWAGDGIVVNALHPGGIRTNLQRYVTDEELARMRAASIPSSPVAAWKTTEQGAATSALLAGSPLVEGVTGRYFEDVNEAKPNQPGHRTGVAAYALDPAAAERLWAVSLAALA